MKDRPLTDFDRTVLAQMEQIRAIGRKRLRNQNELDDFVQETIARVYANRSRLRDPAKLKQWTAGVARNTANEWNRAFDRMKREQPLQDEIGIQDEIDPLDALEQAERNEQIRQAIAEAAAGLESVTGGRWCISRDHHYQLSNRFAWSWKLASLGIPVVLVYLGFLNAQDMVDRSSPFQSEDEWDRTLREYCKGVVDEGCWGNRLDIAGAPLLPLIRAVDQPFVRD